MTLTPAPAAGGDLVLPVRMRADLVIVPRPTRHGRWWTVKDPLTLRYFQLRDEELFVLRQLDGRTPVGSILEAFWRREAPTRLAVEELLAFVQRLAAQGLVTGSAPPAADDVLARRNRRVRRQRGARLANPLAIRWRGFDPQPLLDAVYPLFRWIYSPWVLAAGAAVLLAAVLLIVGDWSQFRLRLPAASALISPGNLVWLALALAVVKVLHELGHALTCRHMGGECHELGLMLLAFVPCLYCNVSDAWLLPSRWRRIAVSAAGIAVELFLAALCTFCWWYTDPGPLNSLCLSIMIVTSAGTLLLNGNPLLRYDGYYILSDLLDVPNLRSRAGTALRRGFARWALGVVEHDGDALDRRWRTPLALYGAASALYLWMVLWVLLRFVDQALEPRGLRPLAFAIAVLVVGSRLGVAGNAAFRRVAEWRSDGIMRPMRFTIGCLLLACGAGVALMVPYPYRVAAPLTVVPRAARNVYVTVPGTLGNAGVSPRPMYGDRVSAGETIAVLVNHDVARELVRLEGECRRQQIVIETLRLQQFAAPESASRLSTARSVLQEFEQQLDQRRRDDAALTLSSPVDGVLYPPLDSPASSRGPLVREGPPLVSRNSQVYLPPGTVVGVVGRPDAYDALLVVDQVDIPDVRPGQRVRLRLPQAGAAACEGRVREVGARTLDASPEALVRSGRLASRVGDDGLVHPVRPVYEVRVEIADPPPALAVGAVGDARIEIGSMNAARRLLRWFDATFARDR